MAKLARDLTYKRTEKGHTDDKVGDQLNEKMGWKTCFCHLSWTTSVNRYRPFKRC